MPPTVKGFSATDIQATNLSATKLRLTIQFRRRRCFPILFETYVSESCFAGCLQKIVIIERVEFKAIRITLATTTQVNLAMFSIWGPGLLSNSHRRRLASKLQNLNLAFVCELFKSDPTHEESPRKKGR